MTEQEWYEEQRKGVKRYETVLVCIAAALAIAALSYGFWRCICS